MADFELYEYSEAVNPALAAEAGCMTTLPIRISKSHALAEEGSRRLITEWTQHGGTEAECETLKEMAFYGGLVPALIPESRPERLAVVARLVDWGFVADDACDQVSHDQSRETREGYAKLFDDCRAQGDPKASLRDSARANQFRMKLLLELFEIDKEKAAHYVDTWSSQISSIEGHDITEFESLHEYVLYRNNEVGGSAAIASIKYCMDLHLSSEEDAGLKQITDMATCAAALCNDYYSWDKEYFDYLKNPTGSRRPMNAVYYLMYKDGLNCGEAKARIREETLKYEQAYVDLRKEYAEENKRMSKNARRYLMATGLMLSGFCWWSCRAKRYNKECFRQPDSLRLRQGKHSEV